MVTSMLAAWLCAMVALRYAVSSTTCLHVRIQDHTGTVLDPHLSFACAYAEIGWGLSIDQGHKSCLSILQVQSMREGNNGGHSMCHLERMTYFALPATLSAIPTLLMAMSSMHPPSRQKPSKCTRGRVLLWNLLMW